MCGSSLSASGFLRIAEGEIRRMMEMDAAVCYISDALRMTAENTANLSGGRYLTSALSERMFDGFDYSRSSKKCGDTKSADEIIRRIREKLKE